MQNNLEQLSRDEQRNLLAQMLREKARQDASFPMSVGQQGLWYAYRRDPALTQFNVYLPTRICSPLDVDAMRQAVELVVQRHASLRTTFNDEQAQLRQRVHARLQPEFAVHDAVAWSETELNERVVLEAKRCFNLEQGPLLRVAIFKRSNRDWVVLATSHHIVVDFWSLILLLMELQQLYPSLVAGRRLDLPLPSATYADFVCWQQRRLTGRGADELREYWKSELNGISNVLELPTDFERPPVFTGEAGATSLQFSKSMTAQLTQHAKARNTTPFAVVHAALQVLLSRYSNQDSFLIGSPFSGRTRYDFEQTVGFFANMLPLKADLEGDPTFNELIERFSTTLLRALEHQDYPLAHIVRHLAPDRDPSRSPLFQYSCTFEKAQDRKEAGRAGFLFPSGHEARDFGGLRQESFYVPPQTCHYDMEFVFELTDTELRGMVIYCRDLFAADSMQLLAATFVQLVASLLDRPGTSISRVSWAPKLGVGAWRTASLLTFLPPETVRQTGIHGDVVTNKASGEPPASTVVNLIELVERALADIPEAVAIRCRETVITFRELRQNAMRIANRLRCLGIQREDLVPVCSQSSPQALVGILGILYSGAGFVPIDLRQPAVSFADMMSDSAAKLVVADDPAHAYLAQCQTPAVVIGDRLHGELEQVKAFPILKSDDLAYVIYTSGSSGKPKGVMIEHAAICNTLAWRKQAVPLSVNDRVLMNFSHQFDAGICIALTTLIQGAELVWVDAEARQDVDALVAQLVRDRITVFPAVPSHMRLVVSHPRINECRDLRQLWCGGECMPSDLPELVRRGTQAGLWNFYGPTETAVEATAYRVHEHDIRRPIPIGTPVLNTQAWILDEFRSPVPAGIPGELAIVGPGLARGYLKRPELTAQRFIQNPLDPSGGSRAYLTGDRCRRLADGNIEFMGRRDDQVKLRGYRIELREIESVLQTAPGVMLAAVKLCRAGTPQATLVAFVTHAGVCDRYKLQAQIRGYLAERLPVYKVPSKIEICDSLPVTSSGKVDRRKLPDVGLEDLDHSRYVAPTTSLERFLVQLWKDFLELERVGIYDNFFSDLGGNSLQAAKLTSHLTEQLGVRVPTSMLFDLADVSQIAQRLVQMHASFVAQRFGSESITAYAPGAISQETKISVGHSNILSISSHPLLAPLKSTGDRIPIFMVHPPGGIIVCYRELARQLSPDQPLVGIRSRGLHGQEQLPESLEQMAAEYVTAIQGFQPDGPYHIGGWSLGGIIAFEMAQQLLDAGKSVRKLWLLDTTIAVGSTDLLPEDEQTNAGQEYGLDLSLEQLSQLDAAEQLPFLWQHAKRIGVLTEDAPEEVVNQVLQELQSLFHHHVKLCSQYRLRPYAGEITLLRPRDVPFAVAVSEDRGWRKVARRVDVHFVPGHHHSMVQPPHVRELAKHLESQ